MVGPDLQSEDPRLAGALDKATLVVIMWILSILSREESGLPKRLK